VGGGRREPGGGRDRREPQVERQGAREKRDVVLEGCLERSGRPPQDRIVPAAFAVHTSGSSSRADPGRRRPPLPPCLSRRSPPTSRSPSRSAARSRRVRSRRLSLSRKSS